MTRKQNTAKQNNWKELMSEGSDFLRPLVQIGREPIHVYSPVFLHR